MDYRFYIYTFLEGGEIMIVGFKTRIYPTKEQEQVLSYYAKCSHMMWNFIVAKYKDCEELPLMTKFGIKGYTQRDLLNEFGVKDIPERIALDVLKRYLDAWRQCFSKTRGRPKFHKYNPNRQSFCMVSTKCKIVGGCIRLSTKRGKEYHTIQPKISINKLFLSSHNIKTIAEPHFTCSYSKWYLSGSYEIEDIAKKEIDNWIGLDWGIKNFYSTSNREFLNYPDSVKREFYRINKLKSIRDKKQKGSKNYEKMKLKVEKADQRLEGLKRNFIKQTTTKLCRDNNIAIEDLTNAKIKMSNKKRRRNMQIAPLTRFNKELQWKCQKFGTQFVAVNPAYTSMTCSHCGVIHKKLTLNDRVFKCDACGYIEDRDINAAINIAARGACCPFISAETI
jgi:putative transposase